jgi:hypothetical protein
MAAARSAVRSGVGAAAADGVGVASEARASVSASPIDAMNSGMDERLPAWV